MATTKKWYWVATQHEDGWRIAFWPNEDEHYNLKGLLVRNRKEVEGMLQGQVIYVEKKKK